MNEKLSGKNPSFRDSNLIKDLQSSCGPVHDQLENFISDPSLSTELSDFCTSLSYTSKGGHGVVSFGEQYDYNGSVLRKSAELPPVIKKLITTVSNEYPDAEVPTQCLINKYEGIEAYLPVHSDDESTIAPGSLIFTLTIGDTGEVKFIDRQSGKEHMISAKNNGIYVMTKQSQSFWTHQIDKSTTFTGVRYSITLRAVHQRYRKSTVVIGDSNTRYLKFGKGAGSFGFYMPGKRIEAHCLDTINPAD